MNEKIVRLKEEYKKNDAKIVSLQAKNKKLAERIRQLEDNDIVGAVRTSGMTIDELLSLLGKNEIKHDLEETDNEI